MTHLFRNLTASGLLLVFSVCLSGCAGQIRTVPETGTSRAQPFLGIEPAPAPVEGASISRLWPGPVMKALQQDINIDVRSDILVKIDGIPVNVENFREVVAALVPGQAITLSFSDPDDIQAATRLLEVVTGDRNDWTGPMAKYEAGVYTARPKVVPDITSDSELAGFLKTTVMQQGLASAVADLHQLFDEWQHSLRGFHSLSRVLFPFQQPYQLPELQQQISAPFIDANAPIEGLFNEIAVNLDLTPPALTECQQQATFNTLVNSVVASQQHLDKAFPGWEQVTLDQVYSDLHYLLREMTGARTLERQLFPERSLNAMNSSMSINYNALLAAASAFSCFISKDTTTLGLPDQAALPKAVMQAIKGDITAAVETERGWVIYGGNGDNHYDLQQIAAVYDPAGNDIYTTTGYRPGSARLIIDHAGNDRYHAGAGSAWLGIAILVDHDGNDIYAGELGANGSGMMGIGMLIDYAGDDVYSGAYFSNGAAFYGAGLLVDLGNGDDSHQSGAFSQGLGGPRGFGLIYDEGGDDRYVANYRMPSVYGTDNVFAGFSQGFGFGMRYYDSGGVGMIVDKQGDDHYDAGEFSQGGAYYWALGILHDHAGNDVYTGSRYSQGFGVHQASGVLKDASGNDTYQGMTAACQGAAWDVALGLLVDSAGDDHYQGDGLCQGAAAMQAQAWLIDMTGQDTYSASGASSQGNSGRNHYHYDPERPVYSWSVLMDLGPGEDRYSSGRKPGQVTTTRQFDEVEPGNSRAYGLFIDLPMEDGVTSD